MSDKEELAHLIRKRGGYNHKLTNFQTFLEPIEDEFAESSTIEEKLKAELRFRSNDLKALLSDFEAVQVSIECLCDEGDLKAQYSKRDQFVDKYNLLLAAAEVILDKTGSNDSTSVRSQQIGSTAVDILNNLDGQVHGVRQSIRLPTIDLPRFDGNYNSWLEFKTPFESLIHFNESITEIQKFHYLRASLKGDALKLIQSLEFTSANYSIAWGVLCNRFHNQRLLTHNHIKSLFDLQPLTRESSTVIQDMVDNIYKHLSALRTLKKPVDHWDDLLVYMLSSKLDKATAREWEKHVAGNERTLEDLKKFLTERAEWLHSLETKQNIKTPQETYIKKGNMRRTSLLTATAAANPSCNFCKESHLIYGCPQFLELDVPTRIERARELKLCINCLCVGHNVKFCRSGPCKKCRRNHNSLLHLDPPASSTTEETKVTLSSRAVSDCTEVLLSTAVVLACDTQGRYQRARAILDNGSQSNFVSQHLCEELKLPVRKINTLVTGINAVSASCSKQCNLTIKSRYSSFKLTIPCIVLPRITDQLPSQPIDISSWNIPTNVDLADPNFEEPGRIELLLGASCFWELIKQDRMTLPRNNLILQNTVFGWIVSGGLTHTIPKIQTYFSKNTELDDNLRKFWEVEECHTRQLSPDEIMCEEHFLGNVARTEEGRYAIRIPLKYPSSYLGESKQVATKRLLHLERTFLHNETLRSQYATFMKEYEDLGHMTLVNDLQGNEPSYYLPHHGVMKHDSVTTKLRVVFDGSSHSSSGWSVNDLQFIGPTIHNELFSILIQFRQYEVAVCADIEKMYRQILIKAEDRHLQHILWRADPKDEISIYSLNTLTYGMTSSPYLAIRCIKHLAQECKTNFPVASKVIEANFYVDDFIASFQSEEEAISVCQDVSNILKDACFPLRKWTSNNSNILALFRKPDDPVSVVSFTGDKQVKTLGVVWNNYSDTFSCKIPKLNIESAITKRLILSDISKLFDPLGLLGPCVIVAKTIIQQLWAWQLAWDDLVSTDLAEKWVHFRNNLSKLNDFQLNRHAICKNPVKIELHGFSDASNSAYAACLYLRSIDSKGSVHTHLLCAKTRVAPLKVLTTPRLELCGALLLTQLLQKVLRSLTFNPKYFLWSDSQIVLWWIRTPSHLLNIFVGNRVAEIQKTTNWSDWSYVNTKENPADLASRGVSPDTLINSQ